MHKKVGKVGILESLCIVTSQEVAKYSFQKRMYTLFPSPRSCLGQSGGYMIYAWVKVQNLENPELSKFKTCCMYTK